MDTNKYMITRSSFFSESMPEMFTEFLLDTRSVHWDPEDNNNNNKRDVFSFSKF